MARDKIFIEDLRVDCVVGILPQERTQTQPLFIELELHLDLTVSAHSGRLDATCDYALIASEVAALLEFRRYELLEMAVEELAAMLFGAHPLLDGIRVRIRKPEALRGRAAAPSIEVSRRASDFVHTRERGLEGLYENLQARLYLVHVEPGGEHSVAARADSRHVLAWVVDGELERDGARVQGFDPQTGEGARYVNVGSRRASLFCCDAVRLSPVDAMVAARG